MTSIKAAHGQRERSRRLDRGSQRAFPLTWKPLLSRVLPGWPLIVSGLKTQPIAALYLAACAFTSQCLVHIDDEERVFEPAFLAVFSAEEVIAFGRRSVERTAPSDQRMMLGWMLPAMTRLDADVFLSRMPPALAGELREMVESTAP